MITVYTDSSLVPLDPAPKRDLTDQPDYNYLTDSLKRQADEWLTTQMDKTLAFVIPFGRILKLGVKGRDVVAVKRALSRAGYIRWNPLEFTSTFGKYAVRSIEDFQRNHNLVPDGQVGPATLKRLAPYFDAYAFRLYVGYSPGTPPDTVKRNAIVSYAWWGYNNRGAIHYLQRRPMAPLSELKILPKWCDCSEFYTDACRWAGVADPNGSGYDGFGYTGTIAGHCKHVPLMEAQPGAGLMWGAPPAYEHIAVYIGGGRCISHGSEPGPLLLSATYRGYPSLVIDPLL